MRVDPDLLDAARARLSAITTGRLSAGPPAPRRTAARRTGLGDGAVAVLCDLPAETICIGADAKRLARLGSLAAAIELSEDIAAIIDRPGRASLDAAFGEDIRRLSVEARALSGPRQWRSVDQILTAHEAERNLARAFWSARFPPGIILGDRRGSDPLPLLEMARRDRLVAALGHAQTACLHEIRAEGLAA